MIRRVLALTLACLVGLFLIVNAFPYLFLALLFWTGGLIAYPLIFLDAVMFYALLAAPFLFCLTMQRRNWGLIACAAVLIPLVAVVPPLMSERLSQRHADQLLADDVDTPLPDTPKSIELAGDTRPYLGRRTPLNDAPCEALCQLLLLSRQVDLVRVRPDHAARATGGMDYVLETRPKLCPDAFEEGVVLLPETRDAVVSGTCFVAREPGLEPIAARIEIRKASFPAPQNLVEDVSHMGSAVTGLRTLKISAAEPGGWSLRLKKTEATFLHWTMPLVLRGAACTPNRSCAGRQVFAFGLRTLGAFEANELALQKLGIKPPDPANRLTPGARVMAMLDRTGSYFASAEKGLVVDWMKSVSCRSEPCGPVTGADEAVLQRLLGDSRTGYFVAQAMSNHPGLVTANLDAVLDRMAADGANSLFSTTAGAALVRLDIDKLRARRDRIMPLIRDNDWKLPQGIGALAGRLGDDTAELISERLVRPASADAAATAACTADADIGAKLVPALLAWLRAQEAEKNRADHAARNVIRALARFGHADEVKDIARARYPELPQEDKQGRSPADIVPCYSR